MPMVKVLLGNQWKMLINTIRSQGIKSYGIYLISALFLAGILYFVSRGIWAVHEDITDPILAGALSYGQLMMIGLIILIGLPQVFKNLYASTDLELLFTLPIPTRKIFWVKYLQSFFGVPLFTFVFLLVPLVVYGIAIQASILFYPVLIVTLLAVIVIGLSIAYLFNLGLIQIIPASRANELMTVMSALSGLFVYLLMMIPRFANDSSLLDLLLSGVPLFPKWVPISWGSNAITTAAHGSMDFLVPLFLLVVFSIVLVFLASSLVEKGFRTGWIRLSEGGSKKKKRKSAKGTASPSLHRPAIAVGIKEWYMIKRDMREWLVFMPILFFIIAPLIGFFQGGADLSEIRAYPQITWPIAQIFFLFLYAVFNGTVSASSIAREGSAAWVIRTLPLSGKSIALGKLWISWLLPFVIITVIEIIAGLALGWAIKDFLLGILMKAVITIGISAMGLWFGTIGAKYNPKNPQQRLKFFTTMLLQMLSLVYLIITFIPYVLLILPVDMIDFVAEVREDTSGFFGAIVSFVFTILKWRTDSPLVMGIVGVILLLLIPIVIGTLFTLASGRKLDKGIVIEQVHSAQTKGLFGGKKGGLL